MSDVLNKIYENIFLNCLYGFRQNRDCQQAIKKLDETIMRKKINYIVDVDIKGGLISLIFANAYLRNKEIKHKIIRII